MGDHNSRIIKRLPSRRYPGRTARITAMLRWLRRLSAATSESRRLFHSARRRVRGSRGRLYNMPGRGVDCPPTCGSGSTSGGDSSNHRWRIWRARAIDGLRGQPLSYELRSGRIVHGRRRGRCRQRMTSVPTPPGRGLTAPSDSAIPLLNALPQGGWGNGRAS
jgi:hypothetical protein